MRWSLFVDTDSLYLETRNRYGPAARLDYLNLPLNIVKNTKGIQFFQEKLAIVMRHGKEWPAFVSSLERFGYDVVPTDRGLQQITINSQIEELVSRNKGIVVVTASPNIAELTDVLVEVGAEVKIAMFYESMKILEERNIELIRMNDTWLWRV